MTYPHVTVYRLKFIREDWVEIWATVKTKHSQFDIELGCHRSVLAEAGGVQALIIKEVKGET